MIGSGFTPTSGEMLQTSQCSDWILGPNIAYIEGVFHHNNVVTITVTIRIQKIIDCIMSIDQTKKIDNRDVNCHHFHDGRKQVFTL